MPKKILIVEDEEDLSTYFATMLEDNGYQAITAANGIEAMEKVRNERSDLVTLDITMPEKSGVKVYREIKEDAQLKTIPVLMVTGVGQAFQRFISTRRQVPPPEGYIEKPLDPQNFLAEVKRLLG
jgi:DNA-binding response OmpR family regulator